MLLKNNEMIKSEAEDRLKLANK